MIRQVWLFVLLLSLPWFAGAELNDPPAKKEEGKTTSKQSLKDGEHMKQTPFGRMKQGPAKKSAEPDVGRFVEVEEQGDTIIFRRSTPFGKQVWKRQRAQLSDVEKRCWSAIRRRFRRSPARTNPQKIPGKSRGNRGPARSVVEFNGSHVVLGAQ